MKNDTIDPRMLQHAARVLRIIAHPARLRIIEKLKVRECSVGELAASLNFPQTVISKHLALLKTGGIVASKTDFNFRYYSLANTKILEILKCIKQSCHQEV